MAIATGAYDPFMQVVFRKKIGAYLVQFSSVYRHALYDTYDTRLSRFNCSRLLFAFAFGT
jgi:hypothetical protein